MIFKTFLNQIKGTSQKCYKKRLTLTNQSYFSILAGVTGIEPALTVLETAALPLNYTPRTADNIIWKYNRLFNLFF